MTVRLEVIVGPMFSGKTERLIARLHRAQYARKRVRILKPAHDTRTQGMIAARAVKQTNEAYRDADGDLEERLRAAFEQLTKEVGGNGSKSASLMIVQAPTAGAAASVVRAHRPSARKCRRLMVMPRFSRRRMNESCRAIAPYRAPCVNVGSSGAAAARFQARDPV